MYWLEDYGSASIGWKFWSVWCVLDVCWAVGVWVWLPETGGRGLEEVDEMFVRGLRHNVFRDTEAKRVMRTNDGDGGRLEGVLFGGGRWEEVELDDRERGSVRGRALSVASEVEREEAVQAVKT